MSPNLFSLSAPSANSIFPNAALDVVVPVSAVVYPTMPTFKPLMVSTVYGCAQSTGE
ncbi:MAG: hypothetical protein K2M43_01155 [Mycoplasmoidaceae bacterium]|nr:hypothetical protein [Mycoplasmoidaceae bacterium]